MIDNARMIAKTKLDLLPEIIKEFIKFSSRKTSKLENFTNLEELNEVLNRRGTNADELFYLVSPPDEVKEDE